MFVILEKMKQAVLVPTDAEPFSVFLRGQLLTLYQQNKERPSAVQPTGFMLMGQLFPFVLATRGQEGSSFAVLAGNRED
jgi:hypothetical protein